MMKKQVGDIVDEGIQNREWWTRAPANGDAVRAVSGNITNSGHISVGSFATTNNIIGIRPAVWVIR